MRAFSAFATWLAALTAALDASVGEWGWAVFLLCMAGVNGILWAIN